MTVLLETGTILDGPEDDLTERWKARGLHVVDSFMRGFGFVLVVLFFFSQVWRVDDWCKIVCQLYSTVKKRKNT